MYYDGPTLARSPVIATLADAPSRDADGTPRLKLRVLDRDCAYFSDQGKPPTTAPSEQRHGLFIRVRGGQPVGYEVEVPATSTKSAAMAGAPVRGEAVAELLHRLLTQAGLTAPEADGLIACWRPQFLETDGSRFLLVMSAADYDCLCPLRIRPAPTELARVGLVLTELGSAGK